MNQSDFCHLHVHSDYSLLDGVAKVEELAKQAKACGHIALALTDHGSLGGSVAFYKACKAQGIKPILGLEGYLAFGEEPGAHRVKQATEQSKETNKKYNHITLLARNLEGWKNLSKLSSISYLQGFYYKPRIDLDLLRQHREGLIVLGGCLSGPVSIPLVKDDYEEARRVAGLYKDIFGDNYYGEIQPNAAVNQKKVNDGWRRLSKDLGLKLAASADLHYIHPEDAMVQETRICISTSGKLDDPGRTHLTTGDLYFRSTEEMYQFFSGVPEAVLATREIADKVENYSILADGKYFLPKFHPPDGLTSRQYLWKLAEEGLAKRYGPEAPRHRKQLDYELGVIEKLGFIDYFLIVVDLITWARQNGCPVGPGRGSVAGSIVAYALGITDIDPIRYGLYFERFLNPDRVSMPDIDMDFCEENRHKVVEYVKRKYGENNVCQIVTYGTMKARMVLKDVGRVMGLGAKEVGILTDMIPEEVDITLEEALERVPELKKSATKTRIKEMFDVGLRLEGVNRHTGVHAAGVVISDLPLVERIPLAQPPGTDQITTQFAMGEVEEVGLLKFDFLGLKTLTVIEHCLQLIHKTTGTVIDIGQIPLNDPRTFALLQRGDSRGVFQLESDGMRKVLVDLKPDSIEDIMALVALYRPGPLDSGMVETYIHRKHGLEPVTYAHPILEPIMAETFGTLVYQETIMALAHKLAGFSLAEADGIRKAIGKKKFDQLVKYKEKLIAGCVKNGMSEERALKLWDQIEKFANYSFNKAHSAAYATIAYRTAYLKANFPIQYMAAYLTSIRGDAEKLKDFVEEVRSMGIRIKPPDINRSGRGFDVLADEKGFYILYGLEAVKGCGSIAVDSILEARRLAGGQFNSLYTFCDKVELRVVNHKIVETLAKADAFRCFNLSRGQAVGMVTSALSHGKSNRDKAQGNLFDGQQDPPPPPPVPVNEVTAEKEAYGFYLLQHPLEEKRGLFEAVATAKIGELDQPGAYVVIGGLVTDLRKIFDKNMNEMAFVKVEDLTGSITCVAFAKVWAKIRDAVKPVTEGQEQKVFVVGQLDNSRGEMNLRAFNIIPFEQIKCKSILELDLPISEQDRLAEIMVMASYPRSDIRVLYRLRDEQAGLIKGPFVAGHLEKAEQITTTKQKLLNSLPPTVNIKVGTRLETQ
jgi:DNA polymerase-3 subunit alpha